jgi:hypothetical protein
MVLRFDRIAGLSSDLTIDPDLAGHHRPLGFLTTHA